MFEVNRTRLAIMSVFYFVALNEKMWSVVKYWLSLVLLNHMQSLSKDEGGRHTPFFNNYRPQFYFRTTDVTGACQLPKDVEMVVIKEWSMPSTFILTQTQSYLTE